MITRRLTLRRMYANLRQAVDAITGFTDSVTRRLGRGATDSWSVSDAARVSSQTQRAADAITGFTDSA